RLALSDMTAEPAQLRRELTDLEGWIACIADARPLTELAILLRSAGFAIEQVEHLDDALEALLERVDHRLRAAAVVGAFDADAIARGAELVDAARASISSGYLGYAVVIARKR